MKTRKPTGRAPWPCMLITGPQKVGKTWLCAEASASKYVARTLWVSFGESDPDEYGAIPGARFELVEHDGSYRGILNALIECAREPAAGEGLVNLVVLDQGTRVWELLCDMAQDEANQRAIAKARRQRKPIPEDDVVIGQDLWNVAKSRWQNILDALRDNPGPSIITARLENQVVVLNGEPTNERVDKVKAEKNLPFDVDAIVEIQARKKAHLTGFRSVKLGLDEKTDDRIQLPAKFGVQTIWEMLGVVEKSGPRQQQRAAVTSSLTAERQMERQALLGRLKAAVPQAEAAKVSREWVKAHGHPVTETDDLDSLTVLVVTWESADQEQEKQPEPAGAAS